MQQDAFMESQIPLMWSLTTISESLLSLTAEMLLEEKKISTELLDYPQSERIFLTKNLEVSLIIKTMEMSLKLLICFSLPITLKSESLKTILDN